VENLFASLEGDGEEEEEEEEDKELDKENLRVGLVPMLFLICCCWFDMNSM
jgi:hypothetical protein